MEGIKKDGRNNETKGLVEKLKVQYDALYHNIEPFQNSEKPMPRTTQGDSIVRVDIYDWTSGFYPGSLWLLYGLTSDVKWKNIATEFTEKLDTIQYWRGNHDVGFMMECSYGNALKFVESQKYKDIIVSTAKSLSSRFNPEVGAIRSWDWGKEWQYPVIIDNMMNLELLFHATKITGDSTFYKIAVSHADTTMKNHFRENGSSYHVVDYDPDNGLVNAKVTRQGLTDESAWARGQAWAVYGYTVCYRETKNKKYLEQVEKTLNFIKNNQNLTNDHVPYWDYDAPVEKGTPRDVSAAAILASALYEFKNYVAEDRKEEFINMANEIMKSLTSDDYLAKAGTNKGFLLKHSVGDLPRGSEIDVPLNYADYYFLEALFRKSAAMSL